MTPVTESNVHSIGGRAPERNPGLPFSADLFGHIRINRSAVERRAASFGKRRSIKKDYQAAWLLKAITCIDLTTLAGDPVLFVHSLHSLTIPTPHGLRRRAAGRPSTCSRIAGPIW
jgi:hypothetical protein